MPRIRVNGQWQHPDADADTPLLWVLRDHLQLKGPKFGCGVGICGICTVLADGEPLHSCMVSLGEAAGRDITTIEGLARSGHPLLSAWLAEQVPQCGYCQPGQIITAAALLARHPHPDAEQIAEAMNGVLCRCGTYQRVRRGVARATQLTAAQARPLAEAAGVDDAGVTLDDWIRIGNDGTVTVQINHAEMGQGVTTALAALIAEELEVDLSQVRTEFAPAERRYRNPVFDEQTTGGSTSVRGEWERLSRAGARVRVRLIKAAARQWRARQRDCVAEHGTVLHRPTGRRLAYGALAPSAAAIAAPQRVRLKGPHEYRLLGRPLPRLELPDMTAGRAVYGIDVALPGCRVASVLRCPVFGGSLRRYDAAAARAVPGVERVLAITGGVAVVARDTWSALRGREALQVDWDPGPAPRLDNAVLEQLLEAGLNTAGEVRRHRGRPAQLLKGAEQVIEADYNTAPLAHAALEPMNCTARLTADGCEVWVGTQSQEGARNTAAAVSGLPLRKVRVHSQYLGGAFGGRLESDAVADAVELAQATGWPVQVLWTRADDMQHDHYRPPFRARLRGLLDRDGWPLAWWQRGAGAGVAGEAWAQCPYEIPHLHTEFVAVDTPLPAGAWRSVGAGQDAFAVESFIDELARAAGRDPFEYRRALLGDAPYHRAVLESAAEKAGWGTPAPAGHYRGIAAYRSFGSYAAEVAEVSVHAGVINVHRVVCAVDCGRIVNPDTVRAQMEGGIAFGLSAALKEAVVVENGRVPQGTYQDYPILTFAEMPEVEVHIIRSDGPPGGAGEPGVPPIAPAVANAVAAATGIRLRGLPLRLPA
ncbi:MAG: molybdopterin-dependent oxidoreductase [Gammaproteobacteria bacterium]